MGLEMSPRILIVDDEERALVFLARFLESIGFAVTSAATGAQALGRYRAEPHDVVLTDLIMPEMDGLELVRQLRGLGSAAVILVMTGYATVETAVQAIKDGATDYLTKPLDLPHLELVLRRELERRQQSAELALLRQQLAGRGSFEGLVGVSAPMQRVYELVERVAPAEATVLIQGETGTGKELVARAIHRRSPRQDGPFVAVNCGALTESLLDSELFGHEKGAFTGATRQRRGLVEQAAAGTLFLDEIEAMTAALQVKLLRAIQERSIVRVGGEQSVAVDFRLLAASNTSLEDRLADGSFRPDLFYRLNVVHIQMPPLRERGDDVALLVDHFVRHHAAAGVAPRVSAPAMMLLCAYDWPGNVRELANWAERAALLHGGDTIDVDDLPAAMRAATPAAGPAAVPAELPFREARERFEKSYFEALLERAGGHVAAAAAQAGITRRHLYSKIKQYGIRRD